MVEAPSVSEAPSGANREILASLASTAATASSLPPVEIDLSVQPPPVVLYVRDLRGVVAAAPMPVGATAAGLKRKAAEMTGVPEDEFALSSGGKLLECRARTLDELGIVSGYVIDQSGRLRGGDSVRINKANRDACTRSSKAIMGADYDTHMTLTES